MYRYNRSQIHGACNKLYSILFSQPPFFDYLETIFCGNISKMITVLMAECLYQGIFDDINSDLKIVIDGYEQLKHNGFIKNSD